MDEERRQFEQREIKAFIKQAFQELPSFTEDHYVQFNSEISSEMFVSVMSILQERLPCSQFYFRQRRLFKQNLMRQAAANCSGEDIHMNGDMQTFGSCAAMCGLNIDICSRSPNCQPKNSPQSKENSNLSLEASYVTAIAQPKIIDAWSPIKKSAFNKKQSF